jgi:predicted dehydrogenase
VLRQIPDVEVVGHVSQDAIRAQSQADQWGGRAFTRIDDLLDREQPQAVWICVTPDRHGAPELALIERGVSFFVEKPLAIDFATAEIIARRLEPNGPIVGVGYKFRALDTLPRARRLLREHPPRMVLAAWHDALPSPEWCRKAERSGGQIVEQATHLLDLARILVGEAEVLAGMGRRWPRADAGATDVPDVSAGFLRFLTPDGPIPGLLSATSLLRGHSAIHLQLVCEGGVLTISERRLLVDSGQATDEWPTAADPFLVEDRAFVAAVTSGDRSGVLCSYLDGLESHRLACELRAALDS